MKQRKFSNKTSMFLIDTACARNGCGKRALSNITGIPYGVIHFLYTGSIRLDEYCYEILVEAAGLN